MADRIRWGILGTGWVAHRFVQDLRRLPEAALAGVASLTRDLAEPFARAMGIPRVYDSRDAMLADPGIDIVYIATPHAGHCGDSLACLKAGKAVLCEKPFALNAAQAGQVAERARQAKQFCMEAMWMRFNPLVRAVRKMVQDGRIGRPQMLMADFGQPVPFDPNHRLYNAALGGGALLDQGVYGVSLAHYLLGTPLQVTGAAVIGATGVDEQFSATLRHKGGAVAVLSATLKAWTSNQATLYGTDAQVTLQEPFFCPERLSVRYRPPPASSAPQAGRTLRSRLRHHRLLRRLHLRFGRGLTRFLKDIKSDTVALVDGHGYGYEAIEAMRCLRSGEWQSPTHPLADTIAVLQVMDELRRQWNLHYPMERPTADAAAAKP